MMFLALFIACAPGASDSGSPTSTAGPHAIVGTVSDDFTSAALALVDLSTLAIADDLVPTSTDTVLVTRNDTLILLDRVSNTLTMYDIVDEAAPDWTSPSLQFALEEGANPQDVQVCGGSWVVSEYGTAHLAVYDFAGNQQSPIDLSAYADVDGRPETANMVVAGDDLLVALQEFDESTWKPSGPGKIVRVDCDTHAIVGDFDVGPDPTLAADLSSPDDVMVRTGIYDAPDGGIDVYDRRTGELHGHLADDATLGGDLADLQTGTGDEAFFSVARPDGTYDLYCLNEASPDAPVYAGSTDQFVSGLGVDSRHRGWVLGRPDYTGHDAAGGISIYDLTTCTLVKSPADIPLTLSPYSVTFW